MKPLYHTVLNCRFDSVEIQKNLKIASPSQNSCIAGDHQKTKHTVETIYGSEEKNLQPISPHKNKKSWIVDSDTRHEARWAKSGVWGSERLAWRQGGVDRFASHAGGKVATAVYGVALSDATFPAAVWQAVEKRPSSDSAHPRCHNLYLGCPLNKYII